MIIDAHAHAFPDMRGPSGYPNVKAHLAAQQASLGGFWGRMASSTVDERYKPLSGEEIDFRVGAFGKYYWNKNGAECWLQRFPPIMEFPEWKPEQMIAFMDHESVDMALLQTGYMEDNFCRSFYRDCISKWPDRFIPTVTVDYDVARPAEYRLAELKKIESSVDEMGTKGVFQSFPRSRRIDHEAMDPLWEMLGRLSLPHILITGFTNKADYLRSLVEIANVADRFPDVSIVLTHLGGNILPRHSPDFTETPSELLPLLRRKNVWFEVGYVLAYESRDVWGDSYEYPYPEHSELVRRVYEEVGADRLIWQSDMPHLYRTCTYRQSLDLVRIHMDFLRAEEKSAVLGGNAAKLYRVRKQNIDRAKGV